MIHSLIHTILDGGIISISFREPNHNHPRIFLNNIGLHIRIKLNLTPTQECKHQPLLSRTKSFEDKVLQALKGLEMNTQLLHSHTQSIVKLKTQVGQPTKVIIRREHGALPSQAIKNPGGQIGPANLQSSNKIHELVKTDNS